MPESNQSGLSDNTAGALAYVTIIPAIIFLIVEPFNKNSYVRFHAWQSIFMFIALVAIDIVLRVFSFVGLIIMPVVGLVFLVLWVYVLIKALNGQRFKFPLIGDLAEKQANA